MVKSHPSQDGCWYCYDNENTEANPLYFCCEFDTFVHLNCIKRELLTKKELDLEDRELDIIANEFKGLLQESI